MIERLRPGDQIANLYTAAMSTLTQDGRLPGCELYLGHQMQSELLSLRLCLLRNSVQSLRARVQS